MTAPGPTSLASLDGEIMPAGEAPDPRHRRGADPRRRRLRGHARLRRSALRLRGAHGPAGALGAQPASAHRSRGGAGRRLPADRTGRLRARPRSPAHHVITRGGRRLLMTEPLPRTPDHLRLKTVTYAPTRLLDGIKSLSYAANMLASRLAREEGFDEALLVTPHGRVLEAPTSSVFWVEGEQLLTPPLDEHILASITRALVDRGGRCPGADLSDRAPARRRRGVRGLHDAGGSAGGRRWTRSPTPP